MKGSEATATATTVSERHRGKARARHQALTVAVGEVYYTIHSRYNNTQHHHGAYAVLGMKVRRRRAKCGGGRVYGSFGITRQENRYGKITHSAELSEICIEYILGCNRTAMVAFHVFFLSYSRDCYFDQSLTIIDIFPRTFNISFSFVNICN